MNILAIESSCDETAAAVLSGDPKKPEETPKLLSNVVISQIDIFKEYGGVIPEVAARSHLEAILPVLHKAMTDADKTWKDIDAIAVTHTPGLLGSLLVGTLTARTLAILRQKPLYAVHHLKSHIYANWLETEKKPDFPLLALVISGGHTQIIRMEKHNHFEIIGTTLDDAVGECFDKAAKILGLPYPGGPSIAKAAAKGDPQKYPLPHPKIAGLDFSFSGLKTAVLRAVQKEVGVPISHPSHDLKNLLTAQQVADFAASFEKTAVDILLEKLDQAYKIYPDTKSIVIAGGVSANKRLREKIVGISAHEPVSRNAYERSETSEPRDDGSEREWVNSRNTTIFFPKPRFSGDNAAMVAAAAFYEIQQGVPPTDPKSLDISPRSVIE